VRGKKGLTVRHLRKKQAGVYQGSRKGKDRRSATSYISPCADPEELSLSKGLEVHSLLFHEEEEAMERQMHWETGKS